MENLTIQPGPKTPFIELNVAGMVELKGKSIPENSTEFYKPVFDWLDEYANSPSASTKVLVQLEYFNTSSSKCILDIFRKLENIHKSGKSNVSIAWLYDADDEDMLETGEDYSSIVKVPFVFAKSEV
jgi:hypothetical protein